MTRPYNLASELLDRHLAHGRGGRIALVDDRGPVTWAELTDGAKRAGHALVALGLQPEQRVLLVLLDGREFPAVFLGAIKAGLVPVPVNTMLTSADYSYMVRDSRARVVVVSPPCRAKLEEACADLVPRPTIVEPADLAVGSPDLSTAPTTADDVAFWLYTSGSTGTPKGAIHLHSHPGRTARYYAEGVLGLRADDVVYSAAKLFFAYGLGNALTFPFSAGATAILTAERPTPAVVARVMRAHHPTIFCGVPTLYAALLADADVMARGLGDRLRLCVSAGEALPRHLGEAWRARFGCDILDGIGSTELLHIFLSNRPGEVRYGTTGTPVPGYEVELRDEDGRPVPDGHEGALWVQGETACAGYWNNRGRSLDTFQGRWTRTGDTYVKNPDGTYTYCGRSDDMLKVSGQWVSPFEVESALCAHPAVLEAAVVGQRDPDGLVKPKAYVVLKGEATADELKAFVKEKLAPFKYPRWVELVKDLPKTATGKIQRFRLRDG
jgi:benzoate-CoA ligase family protein